MNAHIELTSNVTRMLHLTNSNGRIPFWEANRPLAGTQIPCFLCDSKFYNRFHTRPLIVKVKESRNRLGVAQGVLGGLGSQIFMTFGT